MLARIIEERGLLHEEVELAVGLATGSGQITRLASGERKPGRQLAHRFFTVYRIAMQDWEIPVPRRERPRKAA